jgi:phenylacetate-CoA ligase
MTTLAAAPSVDEARLERVRALVAYAVERSPYYREAIGTGVLRGAFELADLPTLSKATLMNEFDRIVTDPVLRRAELEAHLGGPHPEALFAGRYRVFASSGSSGLRGVLVHSEHEFARWVDAHLPVFEHLGVGPSSRVAPIGAPSPYHLSAQLFAAISAGRPAPPRVSVLSPMTELVSALESFRPDALIGYATAIGDLAREQLAGSLRITPETVITGAELLTPETEQRIAEAWGVRAAQVYATTEAPIVAASGGDGGLHVPTELVWVEVVDRENRAVPIGTPGHKVLLTNLVNRAQPLIRYELTDSVTLAAPDVIASIDGRSDDILLLPARGGGEVSVHPLRLRAPFATLDEVARYQLVHDGRVLQVRIVAAPGAGLDLADRVREAVRAAVEEAGAAVPLRVETVDEIEREGHAAKRKHVKRV